MAGPEDEVMAALQETWDWFAEIARTERPQRFDHMVFTHVKPVLATRGPERNKAYVLFTLTADESLCNVSGNLHGGAQASMFDVLTTMALAPLDRPPGFWQMLGVSRTLNCTYLRAVPAGSRCIIEVEIVHLGARLAELKGSLSMLREGEEAGKGRGILCTLCAHGKANSDPQPAKGKI